MTPNKFKDFQSTIKGFLEVMNGRNLHRLFVFSSCFSNSLKENKAVFFKA
jgi:hypothetical protein